MSPVVRVTVKILGAVAALALIAFLAESALVPLMLQVAHWLE